MSPQANPSNSGTTQKARTPTASVVAALCLAGAHFGAEVRAQDLRTAPEPVPIRLNEQSTRNVTGVSAAAPLTELQKGLNAERRKALEQRSAELHERDVKRYLHWERALGWVASAGAVVGALAYASQMIRNREGTVAGWVIGVVNDSLSAACSAILGPIQNFGIWAGTAVGNYIACTVAWKCANKGSFSPLDKACLGISALGWAGMIFTWQHPVLNAAAAQVVNVVGAVLFFEHQLKNPLAITKLGQGAYISAALLNIYIMSDMGAGALITSIGALAASGLCVAGFIAGHVRESVQRAHARGEVPDAWMQRLNRPVFTAAISRITNLVHRLSESAPQSPPEHR